MDDLDGTRDLIAQSCRILGKLDLTKGGQGHVSQRVSDDTILIRARGPGESGVRFASRRDIILVEDIVDTGLTTSYATGYLWRKGASSVKLCTLLDKPSRRRVPVAPDYLGFTVPNEFVVGYGLDLDEQYRHLPDIHVLTGGVHEP